MFAYKLVGDICFFLFLHFTFFVLSFRRMGLSICGNLDVYIYDV